MCAAGGGASERVHEAIEVARSPNASIVTPAASLRTQPPRPCAAASRYTHGRESDALDGAADFNATPARRRMR